MPPPPLQPFLSCYISVIIIIVIIIIYFGKKEYSDRKEVKFIFERDVIDKKVALNSIHKPTEHPILYIKSHIDVDRYVCHYTTTLYILAHHWRLYIDNNKERTPWTDNCFILSVQPAPDPNYLLFSIRLPFLFVFSTTVNGLVPSLSFSIRHKCWNIFVNPFFFSMAKKWLDDDDGWLFKGYMDTYIHDWTIAIHHELNWFVIYDTPSHDGKR